MVGRNLKLVGVAFAWWDFEESIVPSPRRRNVESVVMEIGGLVQAIGEADLHGVTGFSLQPRAGNLTVVSEQVGVAISQLHLLHLGDQVKAEQTTVAAVYRSLSEC